MGFGVGCCIKARAVGPGASVPFSRLPDAVKWGLALRLAHSEAVPA
jgi:hypothetical protein